jgi:hypothetical protein
MVKEQGIVKRCFVIQTNCFVLTLTTSTFSTYVNAVPVVPDATIYPTSKKGCICNTLQYALSKIKNFDLIPFNGKDMISLISVLLT